MKRTLALFALLALLSLAGCGHSSRPWGLPDITGHMPDLKFTLTDDNGQQVNQAAFAGKVDLLYFGYTHCPDVCPTTLADLGKVLRQLGPAAAQVRVLFVSVDPARDTPAVLKSYVNAFGPWFVGLSGSQAQLQALTKRYRVAYRLGKPDAQGNYTVYHSSAVFIFDRQGKARLLTDLDDKPDVIATDLKRLLQE
ncbi:MAG TPA: SCO family protein [Gammaproteobacteria bacterium]|nr:SCO family protein [Gammaproteobacteria bacterium]